MVCVTYLIRCFINNLCDIVWTCNKWCYWFSYYRYKTGSRDYYYVYEIFKKNIIILITFYNERLNFYHDKYNKNILFCAIIIEKVLLRGLNVFVFFLSLK